jgi:ligand-binding SRPBCC domain-containing protein
MDVVIAMSRIYRSTRGDKLPPNRMPREFILERRQVLARPPEEVFAFFSDPRNLEAITPAWLRFTIVRAPEQLERGALLRYRLRLFGVPVSWRTGICEWTPPRSFEDVQIAGPYPLWVHTHRFSPVEGGTEVYDHIRYRLPGGLLAPLVQGLLVGRWLDQIFAYRRARLVTLLGGSSVSNEA